MARQCLAGRNVLYPSDESARLISIDLQRAAFMVTTYRDSARAKISDWDRAIFVEVSAMESTLPFANAKASS